MQIGVDPADLVLPRRPVARDRMDMAVDQPGRDGGAVGVDDRDGALGIDISAVMVSASRIGLSIAPESRSPIFLITSLLGPEACGASWAMDASFPYSACAAILRPPRRRDQGIFVCMQIVARLGF
jgi:hypothetical protein